ncbi:MAG: carboxypeptidase regulatory-like domain-containing protein [Lachnospiraceae bacterium]|nr:carboxypeptidase regulatory-like domain-containing protein [Lachnospiraceae bacterium]
MKKRLLAILAAVSVAAGAMTACGTEKAPENEEVKTEEVKENDSVEEEEATTQAKAEDEGGLKEEPAPAEDKKNDTADEFKDDFSSTLSYIKKNAGKAVSIDYTKSPAKKAGKYTPDDSYQTIEDDLGNYKLTRVNALNSENGATIIVDVYRNRSDGKIGKLISTEYGSLGRVVSGWYLKDDEIIYEYRYNDDLYGTNQHREDYSLSEKDDEEKVRDEGLLTLEAVRDVPGYARVYGYVGDEYGGVLKNVYATIKSAANSFEQETQTNGDGYYEFYVPVNTEDYYNISFTYGDFVPDSANDIRISEGVTEYSCGIMYMAAKGQNKHDTDVYFMNINKKALDNLKDGEYEAVLEYDGSAALLTPYFMSMGDGKSEKKETLKFKPDKDGDWKYYVKDEKNYGSNNMAYDMSKCGASVTIYDKNGIVECFNAPAVHAGVLWEVFEVKNGRILPVGNYYFDTLEGIF